MLFDVFSFHFKVSFVSFLLVSFFTFVLAELSNNEVLTTFPKRVNLQLPLAYSFIRKIHSQRECFTS